MVSTIVKRRWNNVVKIHAALALECSELRLQYTNENGIDSGSRWISVTKNDSKGKEKKVAQFIEKMTVRICSPKHSKRLSSLKLKRLSNPIVQRTSRFKSKRLIKKWSRMFRYFEFFHMKTSEKWREAVKSKSRWRRNSRIGWERR